MKILNGDRSQFLEDEFPDYKLYNISQSIFSNSQSVSKSLMYQFILKQLMTDDYDSMNKQGYSVLDEFLK